MPNTARRRAFPRHEVGFGTGYHDDLAGLVDFQPWSRVGRNLLCTESDAPGAVNIVPNWHDRQGHAVPFTKGVAR
jgi:hypothetical protein